MAKITFVCLEIATGLLAVFGLLVLIALLVMRASGQVACLGDQCTIQAWMAASSGVIAIGVAIPTVIYLVKQHAAMNRHQREMVEIELMNRMALCRRLLREAVPASAASKAVIKVANEHTRADREHFLGRLSHEVGILTKFPTPLLERFDDEISTVFNPDNSAVRLIFNEVTRQLEVCRSRIEDDDYLFDGEVADLRRAAEKANMALAGVCHQCLEFLGRWEPRMSS